MITHLLPMLQEASEVSFKTSGDVQLGTFGTLVLLAVIAFVIAANWKIHTKAGQPGWAMFVPIYGAIVMLRICGRPWWWLLLLWFPVLWIVLCFDLAKRFGQGIGFGLGILFLGIVFIPILAFGDAKYVPVSNS